MEKNSHAGYVIAVILIFLCAGCQKEDPVNGNPPATAGTGPVVPGTPFPGSNPPLTPWPGTSNSFLRAYAGRDYTVMLPPDFFYLNGGADYRGLTNPNLQWHWSNISGPSNAFIEFTDSSYTKVRNPLPGRYEFELTVSVLPGYVARDTVSVEIRRLAPVLSNEFILNSSNWVCDWGFCNLELPGVLNLVPPHTAFLIYLKRDFFSDWLPVANSYQMENHWSSNGREYYYQLVGNTLTNSTMGNDFTDNAKVKLVY